MKNEKEVKIKVMTCIKTVYGDLNEIAIKIITVAINSVFYNLEPTIAILFIAIIR